MKLSEGEFGPHASDGPVCARAWTNLDSPPSREKNR